MKLLQLAQQEIKLEKNVAFFEVSLGGTLCYFTFKKCLNPWSKFPSQWLSVIHVIQFTP